MTPEIRDRLYNEMNRISPGSGLSKICIYDTPTCCGIARVGLHSYREFWNGISTARFIARETIVAGMNHHEEFYNVLWNIYNLINIASEEGFVR